MEIEAVLESAVRPTGRVAQVAGLFDLPAGGTRRTTINCPMPDTTEVWSVGYIGGPSGSGKTTVARRAFQHAVWCGTGAPWPADCAVVDGFPHAMGASAVVDLLSGVGFNSPPAWLQPYNTLSEGQKWRADLARGLAEGLRRGPGTVVCADEFTSVVDRDTAKSGSAAVAKAVRRLGLRLVAVGCHNDCVEWLDPDWVARPVDKTLTRRSLRGRPKARFEIFRCHAAAWSLFREHHYLSHTLAPSSVCFMAVSGETPVGFSAWLPFVGPGAPARREHRTVILPPWQGVGVGMALSGWVASLWRGLGYRAISATAHPGYARSRLRSADWRLNRAPCLSRRGRTGLEARLNRADTRLTAGFEYIGPAMDAKVARSMLLGG
jgi:GNAT superfamily N-acetyltransferase